MSRRLPPFAAVRAFEAAARRLSFKDAAEELHVTQSAVSHQVRALETHLGVELFRRRATGVDLTPTGAAYLEDLSGLLDGLDACTRRIRDADSAGTLSVRTTPGLAARWLVPRLARFNNDYPDIDVDVSTAMPPTDFSRGDVDVFLHWGDTPVPGVEILPFLSASKTPVCLPETAARLNRPADLLNETLLRDRFGDAWDDWFAAAGLPGHSPRNGPAFEHCELVLNAVESGLGIGLCYDALSGAAVASGKLAEPFSLRTSPVLIYSLAYQKARASNPRIAAFRRWILSETEPLELELLNTG